jgi:hypothetical protein
MFTLWLPSMLPSVSTELPMVYAEWKKPPSKCVCC